MMLSERQRDILNKAVFEYIGRAVPVSSGWLEERYHMQISPATIRNEFALLTDRGYLEQPHPSSGRIPTDKGYRFFVDEWFPEGETTIKDTLSEMECSALVLAYYRKMLWKEGWEQLLQEPEFSSTRLVFNFTKFLFDIERNVEQMRIGTPVGIYIGKENPFSKIGDFSMIVCECNFEKKQAGFVALVGPKRMPYHRNISLLHSFVKIWKKRLKK